MPPVDFTQLGIAAIVAAVLWWWISKLLAGDPVPRKTVDEIVGALKERIVQEVADKQLLANQNDALANALQASNAQLATAQQIIQQLIQEE